MVAAFVVSMVVCLLVADLLVAAARRGVAAAHAAKATTQVAGFDLARDRAYHPGHTWVRKTGRRLAQIGLDQFGARLVGAPARVALPEIGARVAAGQPVASLSRRGRTAVLVAPISGRVTAVNRHLFHSPETLWKDPYGGGWLAEIEGDDVVGQVSALRAEEAARTWLDESAATLHRFFAPVGALPAAADGGRPVDCVADLLDERSWRKVRAQFLLNDGE